MKLLDLFCGAGGSAVGYHRAGFEVVGVDNKPQPNYPYPFIQMDALEAMDRLIAGEGLLASDGRTYYLSDFDVIHASPPCQSYSVGQGFGHKTDVPALIAPMRERLQELEVPWVIENVMGAKRELREPAMLCGAMFGIGVIRHRLFETTFGLEQPEHYCHGPEVDRDLVSVTGHGPPPRWYRRNPGRHFTLQIWKDAMDIDWMTRNELRESIPPAYTECIGKQLVEYLSN